MWQELREWRWMRGVAGVVRKEEDDGGGVGWTIFPSVVILFHLWEITANLSRSLRSGNGRADLTVHVSAPWDRGFHYAR
jgi:hypothetical protein